MDIKLVIGVLCSCSFNANAANPHFSPLFVAIKNVVEISTA